MKSFHIHMSIDTFENQLKEKTNDVERRIYCLDMFWIDLKETLEVLEFYKSIWRTVISSEGCNNQDKEWKCLWHEE